MSTPPYLAPLERLRDKCHMIIESVEDECLELGSPGLMVRSYEILKEAYRGFFGHKALSLLLSSMELPDEPLPVDCDASECKKEE